VFFFLVQSGWFPRAISTKAIFMVYFNFGMFCYVKECRKITHFLVQGIPQMFVNVAVQIEIILWLLSVLEAKARIVP
jgi:hypothetical protein